MSNAFLIIDEIEELLNGINDGLTTKLNTISTNVSTLLTNTGVNNTASTTGTLSQKISSAINNTAATTTENSSGTLSAKLTYLINRRNRFVTAGSTNLKTLSSSGSVTVEQYGESYPAGGQYIQKNANGTTYSCYVKFNGIYRVYVTASASIVTSGYGLTRTNTLTEKISVNKMATGETKEYSKTVKSASNAGFSSTTVYQELLLTAGDKINVCLNLMSKCASGDCGTKANTDKLTATWTDISVRGIANEVDNVVM